MGTLWCWKSCTHVSESSLGPLDTEVLSPGRIARTDHCPMEDEPHPSPREGLPDEILSHISSFLHNRDQFEWILTCRHVYELLQPLMYRSIDCTTLKRREGVARTLHNRLDLRLAVRTLDLGDCSGSVSWPPVSEESLHRFHMFSMSECVQESQTFSIALTVGR